MVMAVAAAPLLWICAGQTLTPQFSSEQTQELLLFTMIAMTAKDINSEIRC
jgi:hypothetical protein